ncbi:tRNA1(Val) (adenine(37)-N6)-methyltransferase [Fructilactobacillus sp. Tb1]|uniref:tRNA1(Val) (adenine(37)-N6)-methyltransferase n=1 Tax=Fructilactobacillus sp. Tb1 TaxID=3422304 RepID=UPI003D2850DC
MDQPVELKKGERIDQLYSNDIQIIQNAEVFSFSLDAVMLANFADVKQGYKTKIVDLCAGNGAVGLFISNKTKGHIDEVEIQPKLSDMAQRSVTLNDLDDQMTVYNFDLKDSTKHFRKESFDHVTVNPPYFADEAQSKKNPNEYLAIARHEIKTNLEMVIKTSSELLKNNGKMFMVHRPDRLLDILNEMQKYRLAPKEIQFVYPKTGRDANMVLISGIKDGKVSGLKIKPPVVVYNDDDTYTDEVRKLLYGK